VSETFLSIAELIIKEGYTRFKVVNVHSYLSSVNDIKNLKAVETYVVAKITPKLIFGSNFDHLVSTDLRKIIENFRFYGSKFKSGAPSL